MKATKLVLTGIAIAICAIFVLGTIHQSSKCMRKAGAVHLRDSNKVLRTRTGLMSDPLSMAVKLPN